MSSGGLLEICRKFSVAHNLTSILYEKLEVKNQTPARMGARTNEVLL